MSQQGMRITLPLVMALLLGTAGCVEKKPSSLVSSNQQAEFTQMPSQSIEDDMSNMGRCEQELKALATVDPAKHTELNARFGKVMRGAVGYSDVRKVVNPETQNAIDALYKYQAVKLCAEIRDSMLKALSSKPTEGQPVDGNAVLVR
ncbi:hypothetical protein [Entomohabitans teleogrylli]|uniref:hypothetical protein n=1 Tax=Entomohabitans teleogrylli TaxID=1384589 RepID=UPI000AD6B0AE|nr:hypothetical protein [Entomohabitans teleogrylli]